MVDSDGQSCGQYGLITVNCMVGDGLCLLAMVNHGLDWLIPLWQIMVNKGL